MLERFFPDEIVDKIQDIDFNKLRSKGIKALILDIDNTLVPPFIKEADDGVIDWVKNVKDKGFELCIVSNATKKRVDRFNEKLGLKAIHRASKPMKSAFSKALDLLGFSADEVALVGEQIFTDVYGGNRMGMYTILVKPIDRREALFVRLKRYPEKYIMKKYKEYLMRDRLVAEK